MPTHMVIDKCDTCRGIKRKSYTPYALHLPFDPDQHGAYDEGEEYERDEEEEYEEEEYEEREYEDRSDPGCKYASRRLSVTDLHPD